ncbi:hypothetical protein ACFL6I_05835 [candidate division KSB1 bacterium]
MVEFIILLIAVTVFWFVLEPYYTGKKLPDRFMTKKQVKKNDLTARKDALNDNLKDLELEFQTGMISKDDYSVLHDDYNNRLAHITRELQELDGSGSGGGSIRERIEADVLARRKTEKKIDFSESFINCPECKTEVVGGSNFCPECGFKLK